MPPPLGIHLGRPAVNAVPQSTLAGRAEASLQDVYADAITLDAKRRIFFARDLSGSSIQRDAGASTEYSAQAKGQNFDIERPLDEPHRCQ